jgi:hypothetical protein
LGLGPLVIGMVSDLLSPTLGNESLRWAMSCLSIVSAISIVLFFGAARKIIVDLNKHS